MKKILIIMLILSILVITGCEKEKKDKKEDIKVSINSFDGVYKNGKNKLYIVATKDDELEYYVIDELDNKNYGVLEYKDNVGTDTFEEDITMKLDNDNNIVVSTSKDSNFKSGTYKKSGEYNLDKYFEESYGKEEIYNNKYNGEYTNEDGTIYMYQPKDKAMIFLVRFGEDETSCEAEVDKKGIITCEIIDSKYTLKLDGDKLTYSKESKEEGNYKKVFNKKGTLDKKKIINIFDPYQALED